MSRDAIFRSLLGIVFFLSAVSTWAAPAIRGRFTVRQPDGTFLTIEQFGDEHHHWTSTSDGTLVINQGGAYYVAAIDDAGCLSATSILAHEAPERDIKESADGVSFDIRVSGEDAILSPIVTTAHDQDFYTLQGVRVAVPTKGHIYIHQGHLILFR